MSNYGIVATLPLAPGTLSTCAYYYNHYDSPHRSAITEPSQQHLWSAPPKLCSTIASIIDVDVEELMRLNPSLDRSNCVMEPGFSYCAGEMRRGETRTTRTSSSPSKTTSLDPPICHFDPKKGGYVCPDQPICRFDPQKGEYICPTGAQSGETGQGEDGEHAELK